MDFVTLLPRVWTILQTLAADRIGVITADHLVGVASGGVAFDGALGDVPTVLSWPAAQHARVVDVVCAAVDQPAVALEHGAELPVRFSASAGDAVEVFAVR